MRIGKISNWKMSLRTAGLFVLAALLAALPSAARAAGYTWDGGGTTNNWSNSPNWSNDVGPVSGADTAINFAGTSRTTNVQDIGNPFLLNSLTFASGAGAFSISGNALDFRASSTNAGPSLNQNSASDIMIRNSFNLTNDLAFGGSGAGVVTVTAGLSGAGGLAKNNGSSTLVLNPVGTIALPSTLGFLAVNAGTVRVANGGAGSYVLSLAATGSTGFNGNSSLFVESGATFILDGSATTLYTVGTPQIHNNGQITLSNSSVWTNGAAPGPGGANEVRVGFAGGTGSLTVDTSATLTTGGLRLGNSGFGASPGHGTLKVGSSAMVTTDTLTLDDPTATIDVNGGTLAAGAISESKAGTVVTLRNGGTLRIGDNDASSTFGGTLKNLAGNATGTLAKTGAGTLTLTGASGGFSGGVTLGAGSLGVGNDAALGTGTVVVNGGALFASAADHTMANAISVSGGTVLNVVTAAGDVHNLTLTGAISGQGGLAINAPGGTITLGGTAANTFTGGASVTAGTLVLGKGGSGGGVGADISIGNAASPGAAGSAVVRVGNNMSTSGINITLFPDGLFDFNNRFFFMHDVTMTGGEVRLGTGNVILTGDVTTHGSAASALISGSGGYLNVDGTRTFTVARGTATYDLDVRTSILSGNVAKNGAGIVRLAGSVFGGANFTVNEGTLAVADNVSLFGGTVTLAGGTLVADGGDHSLRSPLSVTENSAIGASVDGAARAIAFIGPASLAAGATLTVSNPAPTSFSGVISGAGGIVKTGPGTLTLSNTASSFTGGLTLNGGTLTLAGDGSLGGAGNVATLNAGRAQFTASTTTARTFNMSNGATLIPAPGGTITYASGASVNGGFLGAGGAHAFTDGSALTGATTAIGTTLTTSGAVSFTNTTLRGTTTQTSGTLTATDTVLSSAGRLTVGGTMNTIGFENNGVLNVNAGGTLANSATALVLGGGSRTTVNAGGTLSTATGATIEVNGGLLVNNGAVTGTTNVHYNGLTTGTGTFGAVSVSENGRFAPGASATPGVFGPAAVSVAALSMAPATSLEVEIGGPIAGSGFDQVNSTATAVLAGTLNVIRANDFAPQPLQQFKILSFPARSGVFNAYTGQEIPHGLAYAPIYSPTDLKLIATLPGDADLDGKVGFSDLVKVAQNYDGILTTDNWWTSGDFNLDGRVGFADLVTVAQNYDSSVVPASLPASFAAEWSLAQAAVPEPTALGLVAAAGMLLMRSRRDRASRS